MKRNGSESDGRFAIGGALLGALSVLALGAPGCSSDDNAAATDSGVADVVTPSDGAAQDSSSLSDGSTDASDGFSITLSGRVFVTHFLHLGDTNADGGASPVAWKDLGANVDGKVSTPGSTDVCTLAAGAAKSVQADGTNGIDNSFGANIVPIFQAIYGSGLDAQVNALLAGGSPSLMTNVQNLTDDPAQTLATTPGQLFTGYHLGTPTFDTTERWTVFENTLVAGTSTAKASFPAGSMASGAWSANGNADVLMPLFLMNVTIHHATVTFTHPSAHRISGVLSGVLDTNEFVEAVRLLLAASSGTSFCSGSTFDAIATQIEQASDILVDGTNASGVSCNGISIGLGFDADETALPTTAVNPAPATNPCGD